VSCGGAPLKVVKQYVADQRIPADPQRVKRSLELSGKARPTKIILVLKMSEDSFA